MYKKCFVACLDILGFENSVGEDDARTIYDRLRRLDKLFAILTGATIPNANPKLHSILMSDTVLLFSENDDERSFKYVSGVVAQTICLGIGLSTTNIATRYTPMRFRGAISWGDFSYSCNDKGKIFFGPAWIDALKWEKKQEWIGAILTPDCIKFIQKQGFNIDSSLIIEYEAPIKEIIINDKNECECNITRQKCLCVNWINQFGCKDVPRGELFEGTDEDGGYRDKLEQTSDFYNYCKSKMQ